MKTLVLILAALLVCSGFAIATAAPWPPPSPQAGPASSTMSGILTAKDGKLFLTDEVTHSTVEVRGEGLRKYVGQRVTVTGQVTPGRDGSPAVLTVSQISRVAAVGGKAAAAGVKAGLSKGAILGIAGGGAAAATVGGLYAADVFSSNDEPVSRQ